MSYMYIAPEYWGKDITSFGLKKSIVNALQDNNIHILGDIDGFSISSVQQIQNMGIKAIKELEDKLHPYKDKSPRMETEAITHISIDDYASFLKSNRQSGSRVLYTNTLSVIQLKYGRLKNSASYTYEVDREHDTVILLLDNMASLKLRGHHVINIKKNDMIVIPMGMEYMWLEDLTVTYLLLRLKNADTEET